MVVPEAAETSEAPLRACPDCGTALQDERQEMCVECGAAVAPAPGAVRRFRWAMQPAALGVFATLMVASAAYGLTSNLGENPSIADQVAAAPPQAAPPAPASPPPAAAAAPAPAPAPAAPSTPAGPPADAKPADPAPAAPPAEPPPPAPSSPSPSPAPSTPAAPSNPGPSHSGGDPGRSNSGGDPSGSPASHDPARHHTDPAWLSEGDQPYSATLYDPFADGSDEHAAAAPKAVDGRVRSAWTTGDHPQGLGKPGVGLVLEAGGYQSYSAIGIQTNTPGLRVEIYTTDAAEPPSGDPSASGSGWRREATKANVKKQQRIALKGATGEPSYVLVWITTLPPGKSRAGLSEVSLLP
jgi:hypothetical protein